MRAIQPDEGGGSESGLVAFCVLPRLPPDTLSLDENKHIINQQQPKIQFNTEHFVFEYNSLFSLSFQPFLGVGDFPGTSIREGLGLPELRNDNELCKVALVKTAQGSL